MLKTHTLIIASALSMATFSANASLVVFDIGTELNQPSIDFGDFTVSGGYSGDFNLASTVTQSFDRVDITSAIVNMDTSPSDGGLGVKSSLTGSTDNLEGSLNNNVNYDEIIFFEFDFIVNVKDIFLNAGAGTGHQDLFSATASDVFGLFVSNDNMMSYTSLTLGNIGIKDFEILNISPFSAQYFAIAHVGPVDSVGGYIESIEYSSVPEPSIIALFGLGIIGLGFARRQGQG